LDAGFDMTGKATRIDLFSLRTPQMRAFHLTWLAFFVCFYAWFACAPLMPVLKGEFHLTPGQIANINIAAVAVTILVRLLVGPLCDRFGPRKTYTGLLVLGAIPVLGVALAQSYEAFLFFRLAIGAIGASFVITQYHTSIMFAPNVVGTANAAAAGWGSFVAAAGNYRVWLLFITYGACFGVEIFIHNIAATYYVDHFGLSLSAAGMAAASFGLLALFARALGGIVSDRVAAKRGLDARTQLLCVLMIGEGLGLFGFAHAGSVTVAVLAMLGFGLFTHMACGATYALVPFIDRRALGGVAGIIGAGGNAGAVAAGFLLKGMADTQATLSVLGVLVGLSAICAIAVRFSAEHKAREQALYDNTLAAAGNA
jgi:nitrate/nitrite transporter NarK